MKRTVAISMLLLFGLFAFAYLVTGFASRIAQQNIMQYLDANGNGGKRK